MKFSLGAVQTKWLVCIFVVVQWCPIQGHPEPVSCPRGKCRVSKKTAGNLWLQGRTTKGKKLERSEGKEMLDDEVHKQVAEETQEVQVSQKEKKHDKQHAEVPKAREKTKEQLDAGSEEIEVEKDSTETGNGKQHREEDRDSYGDGPTKKLEEDGVEESIDHHELREARDEGEEQLPAILNEHEVEEDSAEKLSEDQQREQDGIQGEMDENMRELEEAEDVEEHLTDEANEMRGESVGIADGNRTENAGSMLEMRNQYWGKYKLSDCGWCPYKWKPLSSLKDCRTAAKKLGYRPWETDGIGYYHSSNVIPKGCYLNYLGKIHFNSGRGGKGRTSGGNVDRIFCERMKVGPNVLTITRIECKKPAGGVDLHGRLAFTALWTMANMGASVAGMGSPKGPIAYAKLVAKLTKKGKKASDDSQKILNMLDKTFSGTDQLFVKVWHDKVYPTRGKYVNIRAGQVIYPNIRRAFWGTTSIKLFEWDNPSIFGTNTADPLGGIIVKEADKDYSVDKAVIVAPRAEDGSIYYISYKVENPKIPRPATCPPLVRRRRSSFYWYGYNR